MERITSLNGTFQEMETSDRKLHFTFMVPHTSVKAADPNDKFLGYITGFAATNHLDRSEDIITEEALLEGSKSLAENTTVFLNHDWNSYTYLPIGKIMESKYIQSDGTAGIMIKVGISKTAPNIWTLIEEGILNRFSVGGYITDYEVEKNSEGVYVG